MKKMIILIVFLLIPISFYLVSVKVGHTKIKRLECQDKTITFEKIFLNTPIKESIQSFLEGNYKISSSKINYSLLMESNLKNKLTIEELDKRVISTINKHIKMKKENSSFVDIDYYLYENDKKDPNKKNEDAKKYAGYLVFEFKYDGKLIYKIQTDYMKIDTSDVEERVDCIINSFISID